MKTTNIVKPPHQLRTDGVVFDPPRCDFKLPATRFADLPRDTVLYSPDELDRAFVARSADMRLCAPYPALSLRIVCILLAALELQASAHLKTLYYANRSAQTAGGSNNNNNGGGIAVTKITPDNPELLERIRILVPAVLKKAGERDHPLAALADDDPVVRKVHDAVHGHWMQKRRALGTALSSQLRMCAHDSGMLANSVLGEEDEPFVDREIIDSLVVWRESAEHAVNNRVREGQAAKTVRAAAREAAKRTDTAARDVATCKKFLRTALQLIRLVAQREELRLQHTECLVAELALARRCRQLSPAHFSAAALGGGGAPSPAGKKSASGAAAPTQQQQQQQQLVAQQMLASQQALAPLVHPVPNLFAHAGVRTNPATHLQPQQLDSLVEELVMAFDYRQELPSDE